MALRRFRKARFMTDTSMMPETPNVAETAHFLRRFADMMSVGHNANFLHHAAVWLETLSARLAAAQDEEQLWRYKYETIAEHTDALEAECETLKHDLDGHLNVISSTLGEREALRATLQARETEISELQGHLDREREELAAASQPHQQALAELRASFERERETLTAAFDGERAGFAAVVERRGEELDQLRRQLAEQSKAHELELSQLRLGFAGERHDLAARLKVSGDELATLRVVSERERETLIAKVAGLEAKRAEIRSAFDRIADLKNQANGSQDGAEHSMPAMPGPEAEAEARSNAARPDGRNPAVGEADVVVPRATLRQARSQFEYLAHEFTGSGDVASQVMCELGAFTMDLALGSGRKADPLPVGDVALSILASPGSTASVSAETT
jgi:septal ring factor EnvC (AmiA/AmiB activator)